eukprot:s1373_g7.t1
MFEAEAEIRRWISTFRLTSHFCRKGYGGAGLLAIWCYLMKGVMSGMKKVPVQVPGWFLRVLFRAGSGWFRGAGSGWFRVPGAGVQCSSYASLLRPAAGTDAHWDEIDPTPDAQGETLKRSCASCFAAREPLRSGRGGRQSEDFSECRFFHTPHNVSCVPQRSPASCNLQRWFRPKGRRALPASCPRTRSTEGPVDPFQSSKPITMLRPARLIPSGVQGYHRETIATSNDAFAYCSTMALHIFRLKDNTLQKVIAAHERPISAICWSCSIGMRMAIWDIENEEEKMALKVSEVPTMMDWAFGLEKIAVATSNGSILFWDYKANKTSRVFSVAEKSCKVLRFHPRNAQKLLCGLEDGSLTVYNSQQQKKVHIVGKSKTSKDAVTDAQWDPLSEDYLLVSFADGSLTLFDVSRQAELHSFDKQAQAIRSLAWAKAQPGNFVSATDRVGLLKLWNVSQRTPLGQIKVGNTGVLCVKAVPSEPNWFVLSFKNSAVGVCDIAARTMRFMSSPGHSETIFDVAFHPKDHLSFRPWPPVALRSLKLGS